MFISYSTACVHITAYYREISQGIISDNLPYEKIGNAEPVCIADQVPFEIPDSWEWVRLGDISFTIPTKNYQILQSQVKPQGKFPVVSQSLNLIDGYSDIAPKLLKIEQPLIIFGDHTKIIKYIDFNFVVGADGVKIISPIYIYPKYLYYLLQYERCKIKDRGYSRHFQFLTDLFLPLPPLAEQQRIVAKIEELMPLVEEYDLVETKVSQLNAAFPDKLKKSILQEAVQGKLVAQDPTDEPASELLKRIAEEKKALIKAGKLKKGKNESYIFRRDNSHYEMLNGQERCIDDEIPFEIPDNWEWVRLGDISFTIPTKNYQILQSQVKPQGKFPVVSQSLNLIDGYSDIAHKLLKIERPLIIFGDHTKIIKYIDFNFVVGADGVKIISPIHIYPKYLYYLLQYERCKIKDRGYSRHFQFLTNLFLPIPPLSEQQRIVAKVEELMADIEKLNT